MSSSPGRVPGIAPLQPRPTAGMPRSLRSSLAHCGPVGVFEKEPYAKGTQALAKAVANSDAFSIAGGGDTVAAIHKFKVDKGIDYISTAGGAFLEFLEGKKLPAVAALEARADG